MTISAERWVTSSRQVGRLIDWKPQRMVSSWSPASLGAALLGAIDVAKMRQAGFLWQDAGKTILAIDDGHPVRVATDPYTSLDWTAASDGLRPILRHNFTSDNDWTLTSVDDHPPQRAMHLTVNVSTPFTVLMRWAVGGTVLNFNVPFSLGSNVYGLGYDAAGELYSYTATGFQSGPGLYDQNPHSLAAYVAAASAYIRRDGSQIAAGTNSATAQTIVGIFTNGQTANYPGSLSRLLLVNGQLSASDLAAAEAWIAGGNQSSDSQGALSGISSLSGLSSLVSFAFYLCHLLGQMNYEP